ncbi:MAG: ABC transporter, ATP-binding protein (cluster 3, basic aa/glutamine/opines), partial [uncultured Frankineae bacterium]
EHRQSRVEQPARRPGGRQQALRRAARAQGRRPHRRQGRGRRRHRPLRLGQVDPLPHHQPARDDRQRHDRGRRSAAAGRGQGARAAARPRRHGVPVVQPVRPQDGAAERRARSGQGQGRQEGRRRGPGTGAARARRHRQPGRQVPRAAVRRPAAAGRHRPGAGDGPDGHAVRRADLGPRPGDDQRGPGRHDDPGPRRDDDGRRHPRDGLRPPGRRPGRVHGRRPHRRAGQPRGVLHQPPVTARPGLPVQDPFAL